MIVRIAPDARPSEEEAIRLRLEEAFAEARLLSLPFGRFAVGLSPRPGVPPPPLDLPGVLSVFAPREGEGLVSREAAPGGTRVPLGPVEVGGPTLALVAGPCSVEGRDQIFPLARFLAACGATALRGGAFKPRTSPYAFQGLGREGLALLCEAGRRAGLPVVSEVMDPREVEAAEPYVDLFQVGARSMQNFPLLRTLAEAGKAVLLKRGASSTVQELLGAAEYLLAGGNGKVILCERGIKTFETATRNTLDLNAVALLKERTHLPVLVDPSHGTGRRELVLPLARAAVAAGADGLLLEVHPDPPRALSDGRQSLTVAEFRLLVEEVEAVAWAVGRHLHRPRAARPETVRPEPRASGWGA
jgi:3-deoxy-7-phosphoheptulonate synthase